MNYARIYNDLMNSADRPKHRRDTKAAHEVHHIIPYSLNGSDDKNNLVFLSYKAHYTAHRLLAKMYGGKMYDAYWLMSHSKNIRVTSSQYSYARSRKIENQIGSRHSDETREKMRISRSKVSLPEDFGERISKGLTGRSLSEDHVNNIRNSIRNSYKTRSVIGTSESCSIVYRLTGTTEINKAGFAHSAVYRCCKGLQSIHKGYNWKYEDELLSNI